MKFKILTILALMFVSFNISLAEKSILYVTDNIHISVLFNTKYADLVQGLIDDEYGKGKINLKVVSKFDMNTTQCVELCNALYDRQHQEATILMVGDSNYHNLYGFSSYMKNRARENIGSEKIKRNIYEINNEMLKKYASAKSSTLTKIINGVYKQITYNDAIKTFKPKVVPNFYALNNNFSADTNILASMEAYRHSWKLIKAKEFDKARDFLKSILEKKPSQSILYYALGSVYMAEAKEGAELNALQCFEDGILVDPLNVKNICYKGLSLMFIMYKGEITAEILYFSRELDKLLTKTSADFEAIMSINTVDYDDKIQFIKDWILSDVDRLKNKASSSDTKLIFSSYPEDLEVNKLISSHVSGSSKVMFLENDISNETNIDVVASVMAKKMYNFLKEHKILQ